jgi:hypothetical protein
MIDLSLFLYRDACIDTLQAIHHLPRVPAPSIFDHRQVCTAYLTSFSCLLVSLHWLLFAELGFYV